MLPEGRTDWRTITALNAVSILSQVGQFGIGFVVLPLWVSQHGLNATQLGVFASAEWLGMLIGLAVAPRLNTLIGNRSVIAVGLLGAILAFGLMASTAWPLWVPAGALIGLGMGLRWIGLEPWLYRIAPSDARGRLVGFHETLIGIAPHPGAGLDQVGRHHRFRPVCAGCCLHRCGIDPAAAHAARARRVERALSRLQPGPCPCP